MSGHSHWATIRFKKGAADAKKGAAFSKLAKNITSAARVGGGDPDSNLKLKYAMDKAREANMPKDNISRAVKKGTGELPGEIIEELTYEGYGPGGVAMMIDLLTDNRNRTASELRKIFDVKGGNIGEAGCVSWMFKNKGIIAVEGSSIEEDKIMEIALETGADNMDTYNGIYEIVCDPKDFERIKAEITKHGAKIKLAEVMRVPDTRIDLPPEKRAKVLELIDILEEHEDVQNVYNNMNLPDDN